jgi:molybdopterin adenylyltransferase
MHPGATPIAPGSLFWAGRAQRLYKSCQVLYAGAMSRLDETRAFLPLNIAVLTVSDTRDLKTDKSGDTLAELLTASGHRLADRRLVRDDMLVIRAEVQSWIDNPGLDVILTTGGTGFTGRDVTIEAVKPLFEKEIDGFAAVFHRLSYDKIGTSTIQSRACGGLARGTYIFCLPGSPGACRDAWDGLLRWQLDSRHRPCNFVEIMPRLMEHLGVTRSSP